MCNYLSNYDNLNGWSLHSVYIQGLKEFPKVHWSRTSEHQESTDPEKFSTGPEYRNGGNKIC